MSARVDGGAAFPHVEYDRDSTGVIVPRWSEYGMSLRDYFAAAALTGLLANSEHDEGSVQTAYIAYHAADAMLAAREGETPPETA